MVYFRKVLMALLCACSAGCEGGGNSGEGDTDGGMLPADAGMDGSTADGGDVVVEPSISGGLNYTCMVLRTGAAQCWGDNEYKKLGDGSLEDTRPSPTQVRGLLFHVTSISAGRFHTCALLSDGTARCWGNNDDGQLGTNDDAARPLPSQVVGLEGATAISTGGNHTCAIAGGTVKCWGRNSSGQLGDGSYEPRLVPTEVIGLDANAIALTTGSDSTCVIVEGGSAKCWGQNNNGELGNGSPVASNEPVQVSGLTENVVAIASGQAHSCALDTSGAVSCWGYNEYGQVGDGTSSRRLDPEPALGLGSGVVSIAAGDYHSCAVLEDASAMCWGDNLSGKLGIELPVAEEDTPSTVIAVEDDIVQLSAGNNHTCALLSDDSFACWGNDFYGQLGDG